MKITNNGSKCITKKNIKSFCGKSLVDFLIKTALQSKLLEYVFHLLLDSQYEEFSTNHCWLPDYIKKTIILSKEIFFADGSEKKQQVASGQADHFWHSDPSDGLSQFKSTRNSFEAA